MDADEKIAELLLEWEDRHDQGEDLSVDDLCRDCPELAEELRRQIDALKGTDWLKRGVSEIEDGEDADEELPRILGNRYRLDELIGTGGFGKVYRSFDLELQRVVAVKIPRSNAINLLDEARRVAKLRHPSVVAVHDVGDGFVVSDFIDGQSLAQRLESVERLSSGEAAKIAAEVAHALDHAHKEGFIHRDIKPANILLDRDGKAFVADFGIATSENETHHATLGTLPYMAPEQLAGEKHLVDSRADIYSLGVVLYQMLAGKFPYPARTPAALREQILFRAPTTLDRVPARLKRICLKCLAKHPSDRYATAKKFAADLEAFQSKPNPWFIASTVIVLALAGMGVWFSGRGEIQSQATLETSAQGKLVEDGAFVFDGKSRIVTPLERFAPVTLEAWIYPTKYADYGCCWAVGSDIPTKYGIGVSICGVVLSAEYIPVDAGVKGVILSDQSVPLHRWSHIAAVFTENETRLYLDGRQAAKGPPTQPEGGTPFVVGNCGKGNPIDFFIGQIRSVRISKGERYLDDFKPAKTFVPDADAVLIYDGSKSDGLRIPDLSGKGNDGTWEHLGPSPAVKFFPETSMLFVMVPGVTSIEISSDVGRSWHPSANISTAGGTVQWTQAQVDSSLLNGGRLLVRFTDHAGTSHGPIEVNYDPSKVLSVERRVDELREKTSRIRGK